MFFSGCGIGILRFLDGLWVDLELALIGLV